MANSVVGAVNTVRNDAIAQSQNGAAIRVEDVGQSEWRTPVESRNLVTNRALKKKRPLLGGSGL
jgi:hypothetical protein